MLRWLLVGLDLDNYVAEPFSIYATGESWEYLFSPRVGGGGGLPEAIHCLCTHNTFFKMVHSMIVFGKNSDLHCTVLKHLLLLVTCLSMILWMSQSLNCLDLIWRLPRTGGK